MAAGTGTGTPPDIARGARGGIAASLTGRPLDLDQRILAVTSLLDSGGYVPGTGALRAMMFWECVVAGMVDDPDADSDHVRGEDGPRSPTVDAAEARLTASGAFVDASADEPDLIRPRHGRGGAVSSWFRDEPASWSPWFRAMHEFVYGFHDPEPTGLRCGVSDVDDGADLLRMLAADPVAQALTPGVRAGGALAEGGRALLQTFRRLSAAEGKGPVEPYHASWLLARYLCRMARKADLRFGDGEFLGHLASSTHEECPGRDGTVEVTFRDAEGDEGARLRYRPGEGGIVLGVEVPGPMRGRGFGTLALRHAMRSGVVDTAPVPEAARGLFGRHGNLRPDGTYALCRIRWPACKAVDGVRAPAA